MSSTSVMATGPFGGRLPDKVRDLVRALVSPAITRARVPRLDDSSVDLALAEGLGALLGARVAARRIEVPPERRAALVATHHVCLGANVVRASEVATLLDLATDRAIPLMLLKGMALIQSTFGEGERSMGDIDVLVPASRWAETCALVLRAGWTENDVPGRGYTTAHDYVRSFKTARGGTVEIHRFVSEQSLFSLDYEGRDGLFARARRLPSGILVPDDGDLFLTLAAHAAKHTFDLPLRSFCDGMYLLRHRPLRLAELASRAQTWHMTAAFRLWLSSLVWLDEGCIGERVLGEGVLGSGVGSDSDLSRRLGRYIWSRSAHASPWQRFVRLAWLTDSPLEWFQHVATRTGLRAIDLVHARLARHRSMSHLA